MPAKTKRNPANNVVEVILLQNDKHLGEKYEIVKVKPIYARNILLPKNMAVLANGENLNNYKQKIKAADEHRKKKAANLDELFMKIQSENGLTIARKANKDHTLYAKVDEADIAAAIQATHGIEVDSHLFKLKKKITTIGSHTVPFLYKEIKKDVVVNVVAEKEEKKVEEKKEEKAE